MIAKAKAAIRDRLRRSGYDIHQVRVDDKPAYLARYGPDAVNNRRFYNVGSGSFSHPCWTNIDYVSDWYAGQQVNVIHHDLMSADPLPIPDASAEIIYSSHTIEHVEEAATAKLFREAYRALKPGGVLRITTGPDADTDFAAMMRGDDDWFYWDRGRDHSGDWQRLFHQPAQSAPIEERWLHHVFSQLAPNSLSPSPVKIDAAEVRRLIAEKGKIGTLDYLSTLVKFDPERVGHHVSWWNADKIMAFMREAGFNPVRSGYGQSSAPVLRNTFYFDNTHPQMSVYVEAVR